MATDGLIGMNSKFFLEGLQLFIAQLELDLQHPIRHSPTALEQAIA